jgi:phosphoribosyl 1,2-cyclic phosphodiesterase
MAAADLDAGKICAVLVTHEHGDHIRGLEVLMKKLNIPAYATAGTLKDFMHNRRTSDKPIDCRVCRHDEEFTVGDFSIEAFKTSHDAVEPCGFVIKENGLRFGYCTDTGILNHQMLEKLRRCNGIVLESNYCPDMLANGPYPEFLKQRIRSKRRGHLSNKAAADGMRLLGKDLPQVILAHLSETNNTPERVTASARDGLGLLYDEMNMIIATQCGTTKACPQQLSL